MKMFRVHTQADAYSSPWGVGIRVKVLLWEVCWAIFCRWTPKPLNGWRLMWLRSFGAKLHATAFVHGRACINRPWNLTMAARSCAGDGATLYCLDQVQIDVGATIAQQAYLCTGTHDFDHPDVPLKTAPIVVHAHAFVGLRAIVLPGVEVGRGAVVGAGAVLSRDAAAWTIYAGAPARAVGTRRPLPSGPLL